MNREVEVVVVHYKRPNNIPEILSAFRAQTVPVKITLVDAHADGFSLGNDVFHLADNVIRFQHNIGAFTRYLCAFGYNNPFTYFHDDDMVPGERCVEHFVRHAEARQDFGILGQFGRYSKGGVYSPKNVSQSKEFLPVDNVVRGYFFRSMHLHHILRLWWSTQWEDPNSDDLLAAGAMRLFAGLPILLTPACTDLRERISVKNLPDPFALCARPDHIRLRTRSVQQLRSIGWRSLRDQEA